MNIAFTALKGNISPLFPGVKLKLESGKAGSTDKLPEVIVNWYALVWGQQLKKYNVDFLFCSGVEKFVFQTLKNSLEQCGVLLIPKATGTVAETLRLWRMGQWSSIQPIKN